MDSGGLYLVHKLGADAGGPEPAEHTALLKACMFELEELGADNDIALHSLNGRRAYAVIG